MIGLPHGLGDVTGRTPASILADSPSTYKGTSPGRDKLTLRVAATVVDRLLAGVLRIQGTQEESRLDRTRCANGPPAAIRSALRIIDRRNEIAYDRTAGTRISCNCTAGRVITRRPAAALWPAGSPTSFFPY